MGCRRENIVLFASTHVKTEDMDKWTTTTANSPGEVLSPQGYRPQAAESRGQSTGCKSEVLVLSSMVLVTGPSDPKQATDQASVCPLKEGYSTE